MSEKVAFAEIVQEIANTSGASQQFVREVARETTHLIYEGLLRDGVVRLQNFGAFKLRHIPERTGVNPRTGEPLTIPEQNKVVFQPEKSLRTFINRKYNHLLPRIVEDFPTELLATQKVTVVPTQPPIAPVDPGVVFVNKEDLEDTTEFYAPPKNGNGAPGFHKAPGRSPKPPAPARHKSQGREEEHHRSSGTWFGLAVAALLLILFLVLPQNHSSLFSTKTQLAQPTPLETELISNDLAQNSANNEAPADESEPENSALNKSSVESEPAQDKGDGILREDREHRVAEGETLWGLAGVYYKDSYWWPNIYRANTEQIDDPDFIRPQMAITVPGLKSDTKKPVDSDKRDVALGHLEAYFAYKRVGKPKARLHLVAAKYFDPTVVEDARALIAAEDIAMLSR